MRRREMSDKDFTMAINDVRRYVSNGTPWPVATGKVADEWGIPRNRLQTEMTRRRNMQRKRRNEVAA